MRERFLDLAALLPAHAAVDGYHRFRLADEAADTLGHIAQRVAVFSEDDQLTTVTLGVEHFTVVLEQP